MSQALAAYGVLLKRGDGATPTETFATIAEVKSISGPSMSTDVLDVTTHSSAVSGAGREKIASLIDWGEISFDLNFIPTNSQHKQLLADLQARGKHNWKLVFPDVGATEWAFEGIVTSFENDMPVDDVLGASITITITTKPTFPA